VKTIQKGKELKIVPKIQEQLDGVHRITIPHDIVRGKNWKKHDDIGFCIVDEFNRPNPGDIFLRKNR
jgi:hypothetical protein